MTKITEAELFNAFCRFNEENKVTSQFSGPSIRGIIVYKASNWKKEYSLASRSYIVNSGNKRFIPGTGGNSLFGSNLDNTDIMVRLDYYNWEVDYCYLLTK